MKLPINNLILFFRIASASWITALNLAFLASFLVILPDIGTYFIHFLQSEINFSRSEISSSLARIGLELLLLLALAIAFAFAYSLLFNLLYWGASRFSALSSYLQRWISPALIGIFLFLAFIQPFFLWISLADLSLADLTRTLTGMRDSNQAGDLASGLTFMQGEQAHLFLLSASAFLALLLVVLGARFFPQFQGYNIGFFLISAVLARLAAFSIIDSLAYKNVLLDIALFLFFIVIIYVMLHIRRRQHLIPYYETYYRKLPLLKYALLLSLLLGALKSAYGLNWLSLDQLALDQLSPDQSFWSWMLYRHAPLSQFDPLFSFLLDCLLYASIYWSISAAAISSSILKTLLGKAFLQIVRSPFYTIGASALTLLSVLLLYNLHAPALAFSLKHHSGLLATSVYAAGIFFDKDRDANSSWPGGDPDDSNPYLRRHLPLAAQAPEIIGEESPYASLSTLPAHRASPPVFKRGARNDLLLLTLIGDPATLGDLPEWPHRHRLWRSSDRTVAAMRAFFEGLNGVEEQSNQQAPSFIVRLSQAGMRTICAGSGSVYFSSPSSYGLDKGCQIFHSFSREEAIGATAADGDDQLLGIISQLRRVFHKYREDRNFLWLHYQFDGLPSRSAIAAASSLRDLLGKAAYAALLYLPREQLYAELYISDLPQDNAVLSNPDFYNTMAWLAGLRSAPPSGGRQMPGVLYHRPLSYLLASSWIGLFAADRDASEKNYPLYTYHPAGAGLQFFDALSGAVIWKRTAP